MNELPENVVVEEHYRIRRSDGLYSNGGHHPSWSKKGKAWKKLSHLKNSITNTLDSRVYGKYQHSCIIEKTTRMCIEETEDMCDFGEYLKQLQQEEDEKWRKIQEKNIEEAKKNRYEMYLKLKEEFDKNEKILG